MSETSLVSVVEDDRHFRDSMRRLIRSLGYNVEAYSSAADFLASPRLTKTACLIADVHMSARTTNAIERLHEEFKRHIKTQTVLPSADTTAIPHSFLQVMQESLRFMLMLETDNGVIRVTDDDHVMLYERIAEIPIDHCGIFVTEDIDHGLASVDAQRPSGFGPAIERAPKPTRFQCRSQQLPAR